MASTAGWMNCSLIYFSPNPAGQSLIQPLLEPFEHHLSQNSPVKRLFQLKMRPISALGSKSALGNWTVLALIQGSQIRLKNRTVYYFTHRNSPFCRAKTDLCNLQCSSSRGCPLIDSGVHETCKKFWFIEKHR